MMEEQDKPGEPSKKIRRRPGRAPTACAECRRLKLRCDRNVPCEKCATRGVAAICPQGTLATGRGSRSRLVLANTEGLHDTIETLRGRVRELEDSLRNVTSASSNNPHSLHEEEIEVVHAKPPVAQEYDAFNKSAFAPSQIEEERANLINCFGTLRIGPCTQATFLGQTARSEYLIHALADQQPVENITFPRLPKAIVQAAFPDFCGPVNNILGREIFALLPPLSEATHLCEIYLEHGKCLYTALPRDELFNDILSIGYRAESFDSFEGHHVLSLLFIVFALAVLFDPAREPYSTEAQEYYYLSRASLNFPSPGRQTTLYSVQSLIHLAQYVDLNGCDPTGSRAARTYAALGVQSGYSMGLHLNSAHWNLGEDITQQRSRLFWQLFLLDTWISFGLGWPPSISPANIDCALPKDVEPITNKDGQCEMGFHSWAWRYARLVCSIVTTAFGTNTPPYSTILDLDGRIRDFPVPYHLRFSKNDGESSTLHLQRWLLHFYKETTLLNLHRCYFNQVLHDLPNYLLKHRYGPSVMAIYRSAWRLIESLALFWKEIPHLLSRISLAWSQALSAAIVMGLLVTRAPSSCLARSSMEELDKAASLFVEAAPVCRAAAGKLDVVQRICRKAHETIDIGLSTQMATTLTLAELDRLSGKTSLLCDSTSEAATLQSSDRLATTRRYRDHLWSGAEEHGHNQQNFHPVIAHDMMLFDIDNFGMDHRLSPGDIFDYPSSSLPPDSPDLPETPSNAGAFSGPDFFNSQPFGNLQQIAGYQSPGACFGFGFGYGPTVLDASWQSFVEQLGF